MNFSDGGWFAQGSLRVQVLDGGLWSDVPAGQVVLDVPYPIGGKRCPILSRLVRR